MNLGIDTVNITQIPLKPRQFCQSTVKLVAIVPVVCFIEELYLNLGNPALNFNKGFVQFGITHNPDYEPHDFSRPHVLVTYGYVGFCGYTKCNYLL